MKAGSVCSKTSAMAQALLVHAVFAQALRTDSPMESEDRASPMRRRSRLFENTSGKKRAAAQGCNPF